MNYLVTDVNQRRSFLDTREAIQVKISFEKEEKNQVRTDYSPGQISEVKQTKSRM